MNKYFINTMQRFETFEAMAKALGNAYAEYLIYTYTHPGKYKERHKTGHTVDYDGETWYWYDMQAWSIEE